jgi:hypothetical protein
MGSGPSNFQLGLHQVRPSAPVPYSGFTQASVQFHAAPTAPAECNANNLKMTRTRNHAKAADEKHAPLQMLADTATAMASPPISIPQSRHEYSSEETSSSAASPDKSMTKEAREIARREHLTASIVALVEEIRTASDDSKRLVVQTLQEVAEKPSTTLGAFSASNLRRHSPQSVRSQSHEGRHNGYNSEPGDGHNSKDDSASERETVRMVASALLKGMTETRSAGDRQKSKGPNKFPCPASGCTKSFPRECELRLVSIDVLFPISSWLKAS